MVTPMRLQQFLACAVFVFLVSNQSFAGEAEVVVKKNIPYATYNERKVELDLYLPKAKGFRPAIILVHGGGWIKGSRAGFATMAKDLAMHGYVVANIEYRLAGEAKFPGAVSDVKAAIRWMRANAKKYRVDDNKIAGIGGSAGGHLVAMAATTPGQFEGTGGNKNQSSELNASIVMGAGVDQVTRLKNNNGKEIQNCVLFFGAKFTDNPEIYKTASPITHVNKAMSPILFLDGTKDRPGQRYVDMQKKLDTLGVKHDFKTVEGAKHGQWSKPQFRKTYVDIMVKFLKENL